MPIDPELLKAAVKKFRNPDAEAKYWADRARREDKELGVVGLDAQLAPTKERTGWGLKATHGNDRSVMDKGGNGHGR